MDLLDIQKSIRELNFDGWLFYDFANRDLISYRILGLDEHKHASRRWFYFIPANGNPQKILSKVEPKKLEILPGDSHYYLNWEELHALLKNNLPNGSKIAMNYSPNNNIPYISMIDLGTGELIRSFGVEIVSSMDLIQKFEGLVKEDAIKTHMEAMPIMHKITIGAFQEIGRRLKLNESFTEYDISLWMKSQMEKNGLDCMESPPQVSVNEHAADPHFDPAITTVNIKKGDIILIDSWAKIKKTGSIFYDFTMMAYAGTEIPPRYQEVWEIVKGARDRVIKFEKETFEEGKECFGWELDKIARDFITEKGFGQYFVHRTGHSIGQEVHGNAVHLDSLETQDERRIVPYILHSVEPGIYLPDEFMGVRSEIDVYVDGNGVVNVTGPLQEEIYKIEC
ncbi:MAG: M24 family metallopeptidase [Promethearchaeota archaeon]